MTVAAILIHLNGAPRAKQESACLQYCIARGYVAQALVFNAADAVGLVRCAAVAVVVAAYTPADAAELEEIVAKAGGRLEWVRRSRVVREVGRLIAKLFAKQMSVADIAEIVELSTGDIREELRKRNLN